MGSRLISLFALWCWHSLFGIFLPSPRRGSNPFRAVICICYGNRRANCKAMKILDLEGFPNCDFRKFARIAMPNAKDGLFRRVLHWRFLGRL